MHGARIPSRAVRFFVLYRIAKEQTDRRLFTCRYALMRIIFDGSKIRGTLRRRRFPLSDNDLRSHSGGFLMFLIAWGIPREIDLSYFNIMDYDQFGGNAR